MAILNLHIADECCSPELALLLADNRAELHLTDLWVCPRCGTRWQGIAERLDQGEAIKYWKPECPILIFSPNSR